MTYYRTVAITERLPKYTNKEYLTISVKGIEAARFFDEERFETASIIGEVAYWVEKVEDNNDISDGYHTFRELYEHRITLFIALCKELDNNPAYQTYNEVWRTPVVDGWFLMGINTKKGKQISYHLPESKWHETDFARNLPIELYKYDGHTSSDVLKRIKNL